jgi:hypothetical protein
MLGTVSITLKNPASTKIRNHQENYDRKSTYTGSYSNGIVRDSLKEWRERPTRTQWYEQSGEKLVDDKYTALASYTRLTHGKYYVFSASEYQIEPSKKQRCMFMDMVYRFLASEGIENVASIKVAGKDAEMIKSAMAKVGYSKLLKTR